MGFAMFQARFRHLANEVLLASSPQWRRPFEAFPSLTANDVSPPRCSLSSFLSKARVFKLRFRCLSWAIESRPQGLDPPKSPLQEASVATNRCSMLPWALPLLLMLSSCFIWPRKVKLEAATPDSRGRSLSYNQELPFPRALVCPEGHLWLRGTLLFVCRPRRGVRSHSWVQCQSTAGLSDLALAEASSRPSEVS